MTQRLRERDRARESDIQRSGRRTQRDDHSRESRIVHHLGYACAFAAEEDRIAGGKAEMTEGNRPGCGHQDQSRARVTIGDKSLPGRISPYDNIRHVVEYSPPETAVIEQEPAWFDQIDLDPETSGEPQQCTGILRYVGLEQGQAQAISNPEHCKILRQSVT